MVKKCCLFAVVFALVVVMLGAYTRLTDAGLGCPDWPGCYGNMIVDNADPSIEHTKAWTEMVHRYVAGTLGLIIAGLFFVSWVRSSSLYPYRLLTTLLVALVVFQAALGMWTVTWQLHPTVVMSHLLGGMSILALLWLLYCCVSPRLGHYHRQCGVRLALLLGLSVVFFQIALGGWTSSNYAAMACTDFPTCREVWVPELHLHEAFQLFPPLDTNYEGGWLTHPVKVTIHFMHRVGALVVLLYTGLLALWLIAKRPFIRMQASVALILLFVQVGLGVSNIVFFLPLPVAVLHNGVGALLLLAWVTLNIRYVQLTRSVNA